MVAGQQPVAVATDQAQQQQRQQQAAPNEARPLRTSSLVWAVAKAALLGTLLGVTGLLPLAVAGYAAFLHCLRLLLGALLSAEVCFALYYFLVLARDLNALPELHEPPADYNPQQLVASFLQHMARVDDMQLYLSQWFLDAPFDCIKHDNVKELVAFAIFFKTPDEVEAAGLMPQLDELMAELQAMHGLSLPPGYNPGLKFMSHLWGEVPHLYRPLAFYIVMEVIELLSWGILACCGFRRHSILGFTYYTWGLPEPQQQQQQDAKNHQQQLGSSNNQHLHSQQGQPAPLQGSQHLHNKQETSSQQLQDIRADRQLPASKKQKQRQKQQQLHGKAEQQKQQQASWRGRQGAGDLSYSSNEASPNVQAGPPATRAAGQPDAGAGAGAVPVPLLVLHGVGAGLLPYLGLVLSLAAAAPGQPMLLPVWKQVSMRLMRSIPTVDESVAMVLAALQQHGVSSAAVLGHSYGSLIAARLVRVAPQVVHTLAVVDPVCFAMHMPNLVKYFLYSAHVSGNWVADCFIALLSSEIHCARNFCRNFFWATINLFDEHLPQRTLVVLSGNDLLCPTLYVRRWLEGHTRATVLYHATASHGAGLLLNLPWQCTILNSVLQMIGQAGRDGSTATAAAAAAGSSSDAAVAVTAAAAGPGEVAGIVAVCAGDAGAYDDAAADALCCIAAADARVLCETACCSDSDDPDDGSCCLDDNAGDVEGSEEECSSWGMLAVGGSRSLEHMLRSLAASRLAEGADAGSMLGGKEKGKGRQQGSGDAGQGAGGDGDRDRDGLWGLGGSFVSGLDEAVDLELLYAAASSLVASTYQAAAGSAGTLVGALRGSAGSLQQLQRAAWEGLGQGGQTEADLQQQQQQQQGVQQQQQQQGVQRQGLVRRTQSCGDAARAEGQQWGSGCGTPLVGQWLQAASVAE